ncbi:ornithine cyclodeaminase family protein [Sphingopyxis kveilinensis]|uniref:ornithine cyclodeaminase family protein n=1 Tax=Sphingopyxis kveilinensis TaxID=3114367 RepID=UPI0030CD0555
MTKPIQISEEEIIALVEPAAMHGVMEDVFKAMASGHARNFPVIREQLDIPAPIFGFKSGYDTSDSILGLKAGGYWPTNSERGLANHQSTVILFDADSGRLRALVAGNRLTALRTAAASAVSIARLARNDAATLSILGAGGQAPFQIRAALAQRAFTRVLIANRSRRRAEDLAASLADLDVEIRVTDVEVAASAADVLITITSSFESQIHAGWIRPGTHIAAMGTDTRGKRELPSELVAGAQLFTDEVAQAITIGECQHAYATGDISQEQITPLGDVILGRHAGRPSEDAITLFDGTGVGLQDLFAADYALKCAERLVP